MNVGIIASLVFVGSLILIFTEKLDRTIAAIAGAAVMVSVGIRMGFYSQEQAVETIDYNTLGLLLGMMVLVALLEPTGFFQYLAVWAGKLSKGRPIRLMVLLGTITTVLSMFLPNVTTVVLIAPVTILISEILGINPAPLLMAEAILSDTGGAATLVGDPPNILIASAAGFSFNDFLTHALPIVLVAWLVALVLLRYLFRKDLSVKPTNADAVLELRPAEALEDVPTIRKVLIVLGIVIAGFFLQERLNLSPSFITLFGAAFALVWVRPIIHETLKRVEWSVLLFFVALFILVGGLEHAGVIHQVASLIAGANQLNPVLLGIIIIWGVAALSAVVDNVPITIAMIPVIFELGTVGVNTAPLWWALVFGAGFGGNGTIIGSTANIVVVSLSERTRTPITSKLWNRRGLPVMIATCLVASVLYILLYPILIK